MPETPSPKQLVSVSANNTAVLGGRGRELVAAFDRRRETMSGDGVVKGDGKTRTTDEKQTMLGKYLNNVQDLVEDLKEGGGLFGGGM